MTMNQETENYHGKTLSSRKYIPDFLRYIFKALEAIKGNQLFEKGTGETFHCTLNKPYSKYSNIFHDTKL